MHRANHPTSSRPPASSRLQCERELSCPIETLLFIVIIYVNGAFLYISPTVCHNYNVQMSTRKRWGDIHKQTATPKPEMAQRTT